MVCSGVAQLVARLVLVQEVVGSNPTTAANAALAQLVEHLSCKQGGVGSSPTRGTNQEVCYVRHRVTTDHVGD